MTRRILALLLASSLSTPVWAADEPPPKPPPVETDDDPHIVFVSYAVGRMFTATTLVGNPVTIVFPPGEQVFRPTLPKDSGGGLWETTTLQQGDNPLENILPLTPRVAGTSLASVQTLTNDGKRIIVYPFKLVALSPEQATIDDIRVISALVFGPKPKSAQPAAQPAAPPLAALLAAASAATPVYTPKQIADWKERERAREQLRRDTLAQQQQKSCVFKAWGKSSEIAPLCPTDTGQATKFTWPGQAKKPTVLIVDGNDCNAGADAERVPRWHADGDSTVVEERAKCWRIRLYPNVLNMTNTTYSPVGTAPDTLTTSPNVERRLRTTAAVP